MKFIKWLLIALGFYILYITVQKVGFGQLWENIRALGWKLSVLLVFYPLIFAFDTLGWAYAFPKGPPKRVPFRELYLIRIIGETLNAVVPFSAEATRMSETMAGTRKDRRSARRVGFARAASVRKSSASASIGGEAMTPRFYETGACQADADPVAAVIAGT